MTSARKPSGFLKQNYDKILLVVMLVALLVSAILLVAKLQAGASKIEMTRESLDAVNPIATQALDISDLTTLEETITTPYQLPDSGKKLLVGELRVSSIPDGLPIPYDAAVCPFTGKEQPKVLSMEERDTDGDGMADVWEEANGLNAYDMADAPLDKDGDGFSNLEEFLADTDPSLSTSTPPPPAKLRLVRVQITPFKLRFLGVSEFHNGLRFQLNLRNLEKTYFAQMNEEIEGYEVIAYNPNGPDGPELMLQSGDKKIRLVQNRVVDEQAKVAKLLFLVDGSVHLAKVGGTVSLQGIDYKVVDIQDDRVVIRDEESDRNIDIGTLSADEKRKLSGDGFKTGAQP